MAKQEQTKKMGEIIAKAWADEDFKQRLLNDATSVLREEGLSVPEGMKIKAVENTDQVSHLVLPLAPSGLELSDAQLDGVSGGFIFKHSG